MRTYVVEDLVREVRIIIDENRESSPLIEDGDETTLSLNEVIAYNIPIAAQIVETEAPRYMLGGGEAFATSISWMVGSVGKGRGTIILPDDFLRLVTFQMSDWERPVVEAISDEDPLYRQQFSRNKGLRGSPQCPVVAISNTPAGLVLEFFSCEAGESVTVLRARYIPKPEITENHEIILCEKLKRSIMYYAAYLTEVTYGSAERAQHYLKTSNELAR